MGVFEWVGIAEIVGLGLLAIVLITTARRQERTKTCIPADHTNTAAVGTAAVVAHHQADLGCNFGGDAGGV